MELYQITALHKLMLEQKTIFFFSFLHTNEYTKRNQNNIYFISLLFRVVSHCIARRYPATILYKSIAGRYRPISYPDGPITARYRFKRKLAVF